VKEGTRGILVRNSEKIAKSLKRAKFSPALAPPAAPTSLLAREKEWHVKWR
jgi:hypothetical protein